MGLLCFKLVFSHALCPGPGVQEDTGSLFYSDGEPDSLPDFVDDPEYLRVLRDGLLLQSLIDSLSGQANALRKQLMAMEPDFRKYQVQKEIVVLEDSVAQMREQADSLFGLLAAVEQGKCVSLRPYLVLNREINGIKVYHYQFTRSQKLTGEQVGSGTEESVKAGSGTEESVKAGSGKTESEQNEGKELSFSGVPGQGEKTVVDSLFSIPAGPFYWIQLGVFSQPVDEEYFAGITPVTMVRFGDEGLIKYYAGRFNRLRDARSALHELKRLGFRDAFIISYHDRERMPLNKVELFEAKENEYR